MKSNKLTVRLPLCFTLLFLGMTLIHSLPSQAVMFQNGKNPAPKTGRGGASRGEDICFSDAKTTTSSVTPLMPATNVGLTVAERPTLLVYVPQTSAKEAFLSFEDEQRNHHYQSFIRLPNQPGVMAVELPPQAPPLKVGKNYQWSLVMICGEYLEPDSPEVTGWVRRVEANSTLMNQKTLKASLKKASLLAESGIWVDTVSTLADLRRAEPKNSVYLSHWEELLQSQGLTAIANQPLLNK
ncbi:MULTISPECIES: DUF928 domain-containing protein [unclassified Moorena]|uniref:DUF928 domain-containing protein n=1 Tax=unclassified Moorena TaxID=2683338 RepID=UPI0025F8BA6B|nr:MULTISPECIES: DUF928 domain-containing protein [unclassified Moorena]